MKSEGCGDSGGSYTKIVGWTSKMLFHPSHFCVLAAVGFFRKCAHGFIRSLALQILGRLDKPSECSSKIYVAEGLPTLDMLSKNAPTPSFFCKATSSHFLQKNAP